MNTPVSPSVKFTYDDLVGFPDDGRRHEIIDGEHYVTPSPNTKHQTVVTNVLASVYGYLKDHSIGRARRVVHLAGATRGTDDAACARRAGSGRRDSLAGYPPDG